MAWQKGQSGNLKGRPPKPREMATFMRRALSQRVPNPTDPDKKISRKQLMGQMLSLAITSGEIVFPDGRVMKLDYDQWLSTVRFVSEHLDGQPPKELDITSRGEAVKGFIGISPDDWDEEPAPGSDA